jgi:hypothetical protein
LIIWSISILNIGIYIPLRSVVIGLSTGDMTPLIEYLYSGSQFTLNLFGLTMNTLITTSSYYIRLGLDTFTYPISFLGLSIDIPRIILQSFIRLGVVSLIPGVMSIDIIYRSFRLLFGMDTYFSTLDFIRSTIGWTTQLLDSVVILTDRFEDLDINLNDENDVD